MSPFLNSSSGFKFIPASAIIAVSLPRPVRRCQWKLRARIRLRRILARPASCQAQPDTFAGTVHGIIKAPFVRIYEGFTVRIMLKSEGNQTCSVDAAYRKHERRWKSHRYTYAVVSRRSRGISIGLNLSPGKECNFKCIYCQVHREIRPLCRDVDINRLQMELDAILRDEKSGSLYEAAPFNLLPPLKRGVRDIAFSGDGEPTASPVFDAAVRLFWNFGDCLLGLCGVQEGAE